MKHIIVGALMFGAIGAGPAFAAGRHFRATSILSRTTIPPATMW